MAVFILTTSFLSLLIHASFADNGHNATVVAITNPETPPPLPPPPPLSHGQRQSSSPAFKPSIAVVVGLLTTVFSITFLLLLYARHCKRRNGVVYVHHRHQHRFDGLGTYGYGYGYGGAAAGRKNSGIDRTVIESLPVFRFGALRGHKEGLECAVCLARFEPTEVLRLLPKCKHAFHVECVDTWLDAHSTCPLCRYRVDPEDILLIGADCNLWQDQTPFSHRNEDEPAGPKIDDVSRGSASESARPDPGSWFRRVSGRHSSAGEQASRPSQSKAADDGSDHRTPPPPSSSAAATESRDHPMSFRRSLDSSLVTVGCFDRPQRKDGLLLPDGAITDRKSFERRFEHRIIISGGPQQLMRNERWSDVRASDLLYLRSEMIMSDGRRRMEVEEEGSGRGVIKGRSVSEITSVERKGMMNNNSSNSSHRHQRQRQAAGAITRWLDFWASASAQSLRGVRSHRTPSSTLP